MLNNGHIRRIPGKKMRICSSSDSHVHISSVAYQSPLEVMANSFSFSSARCISKGWHMRCGASHMIQYRLHKFLALDAKDATSLQRVRRIGNPFSFTPSTSLLPSPTLVSSVLASLAISFSLELFSGFSHSAFSVIPWSLVHLAISHFSWRLLCAYAFFYGLYPHGVTVRVYRGAMPSKCPSQFCPRQG